MPGGLRRVPGPQKPLVRAGLPSPFIDAAGYWGSRQVASQLPRFPGAKRHAYPLANNEAVETLGAANLCQQLLALIQPDQPTFRRGRDKLAHDKALPGEPHAFLPDWPTGLRVPRGASRPAQ